MRGFLNYWIIGIQELFPPCTNFQDLWKIRCIFDAFTELTRRSDYLILNCIPRKIADLLWSCLNFWDKFKTRKVLQLNVICILRESLNTRNSWLNFWSIIEILKNYLNSRTSIIPILKFASILRHSRFFDEFCE